MSSRRLPRLLFAATILAELAHTLVAIIGHRIPSGHDGFQYFTLQYFFLNNAIQSGEVAQWIPYMTHGTVATTWYGIQGSLLQNVLLYLAPLVRHADLLTVFHVGVFVDEMILLTGTWLLARRSFGVPAACFVALTVVGSCVWLDQPYWNFRLYYALPLVIELGHRFLDTGRWRWFALAANLLALQTVGNLPYFIPIASFTVCGWFGFYIAANAGIVLAQVRAMRLGVGAVVAVLVAAASFVGPYVVVAVGRDQLTSYNPGRAADGTTNLAGFLSYGGATDLHKWVDVVLNLSPWFDFTLYAGILLAPLILCGLLSIDRRRLHLVLIAVTLLLFSLATPVATVLYYIWPTMTYFRHVGLVSPLVKVLLCFVAGLGFERLFDPASGPSRSVRLPVIASLALLLASGAFALALSRSPGPALTTYVDHLSDPTVDRPEITSEPIAMARRLRSSAAIALAGACLVGIVPFWIRGTRLASQPHLRQALVFGVLVCVGVDVYHFKYTYLFERSDVVWPTSRAVTAPAPLTYPPRRERNLARAVLTNPRVKATLGFNTVLLQHLQGSFARGAKYWTNDAFFFADEAGSSYRVDSWLEPLDRLMRTYWGDPIDDLSIAPRGIAFEHLEFPLAHPAAGVVAGVTADKIRFFSRAYAVASDQMLVPLMTDAAYVGGRLFVEPPENGPAAPLVPAAAVAPWTPERALSSDDSCPLPYTVRRFDANHLVVAVSNPAATAAWMSYADVWHPLWRATVNASPVPVYRADMAYKAVPIGPGENIVAFEFGSRSVVVWSLLLSINAGAWLALLGWLMWTTIFRLH